MSALGLELRFAAVKTRDLKRARQFYEDALALPLTREEDEFVQLDAGGTKLCVDRTSGNPEEEPQLIFCTDDLDSLRQRLIDYGYPPEGKSTDRYFMVRDPDGTLVVFEVR